MPLGVEVAVGPGYIVLDEDSARPPKGVQLVSLSEARHFSLVRK